MTRYGSARYSDDNGSNDSSAGQPCAAAVVANHHLLSPAFYRNYAAFRLPGKAQRAWLSHDLTGPPDPHSPWSGGLTSPAGQMRHSLTAIPGHGPDGTRLPAGRWLRTLSRRRHPADGSAGGSGNHGRRGCPPASPASPAGGA